MNEVIDMHFHVGLVGDEFPKLGGMSSWYRRQLMFQVFLLYAKVRPDEVCDRKLWQKAIQVIRESSIGKVVCLALDPVYDAEGRRAEGRSHFWVANEYILKLKEGLKDRILFGASVHPFDKEFERRMKEFVENEAVLMKWLPSAQQINLADPRVGKAMKLLANAKGDGKALPLLLHVGPEHAIPSSDRSTFSYDFLSWTSRDRIRNLRHPFDRWQVPDVAAIEANIRGALDQGAIIIFGHCGLPYFRTPGNFVSMEHSDFETVRRFLEENKTREEKGAKGRCYADISACCTPVRKRYFPSIDQLPPDYLLFGGDFPVPVFEISRDLQEAALDLQTLMRGDLWRLIVPQDNLLDVNHRELRLAFPGHPLFTNFNKLL